LITAEFAVRASGETSERHDARPLSVNVSHTRVGATRMANHISVRFMSAQYSLKLFLLSVA
jgi:hypothetical protein